MDGWLHFESRRGSCIRQIMYDDWGHYGDNSLELQVVGLEISPI